MAFEGDNSKHEMTEKQLLQKILIELMKMNKYNAEAMEFTVTQKDIELEGEL